MDWGLIATIVGICVAGLAGVLGVWMERDRNAPPKWAWVEYVLSQRGPEVGHLAIEAVHQGGNFGAWKRVFATLPEANPRGLVFGDEARRAGRTGFAALRQEPQRLVQLRPAATDGP